MKRYLIFLLFLLALTMAACSDTSDNESISEDESNEQSTLTIATPEDIDSFDIHDQTSNGSEAILTNMFSYLLKRTDDSDEPANDVAESYESIDDKTWEFKLKEGVTFHNGDPLTAEDVKFTYERVAFDDSLSRHSYFENIKEVEVIDDLTVHFHTHETEPLMVSKISRNGSGILPKEYIEENGIDHFLEEPVGSGPYKLKEWEKDSKVVLEPFDDYFEEDKSDWEEVVFRIIPETSTRVGELLSGGVDIINEVPPSEWDRVDDNDGTSLIDGASTGVMQLIVKQTDDYITSDPKIREAIDYAIDKKAIVENLYQGSGEPIQSGVPEGVFGYDPELLDSYNYDVDHAKKLLEEANYDGTEIKLQSPNGRYTLDKDVAEMVGSMLEEAGLNVQVELMEDSHFIDVYSAEENEELMLISLTNSLFDAHHALEYFPSDASGLTGYNNSDFDELFEKSTSTMDPDEREKELQELQKMALEDRPNIFLFQMNKAYGVNDAIDFEPTITEHFYIPTISKK